jgi:Flp pilus assembly protein TadG
LLARLRRDERGAAMAEFALVLPFMLLLLMGGVETLQLVETQRRVAHAASAMADIVAQDRTIDDAELSDVFLAGRLLMAPLPADPLGQRITSFAANSSGAVQVRWTASAAPYAGRENLSLAPGALKSGQSVIVADVSYRYPTSLQWLLPSGLVLQKRVYLRPRVSDEVLKQVSP